MGPTQKLLAAFGGLLALTAIGTAGYVLTEGASWLDALYMTVITVSTVGYGEVVALHPGGRVFTIVLIAGGVGIGLYFVTSVAELLVEGRIQDVLGRRTMQREIDKLENHVIVCGIGRFGSVVVDELREQQETLVIIECNPDREEKLMRTGAPYVIGSAGEEEILERAGIRRAKAIVIATADHADNVFITLSARELNPRIRIHARCEADSARRRLEQAGADHIISPYQMGGQSVAAALLRPSVVDFLEISSPRSGEEVNLEEIKVDPGCDLCGSSVSDLEQEIQRVRIVALKRDGEPIRIIPEGGTEIRAHDHLVLIGDRPSLEKLSQQAHG